MDEDRTKCVLAAYELAYDILTDFEKLCMLDVLTAYDVLSEFKQKMKAKKEANGNN